MRNSFLIAVFLALIVVASGCIDSTNPETNNGTVDSPPENENKSDDSESSDGADDTTEEVDYSKFEIRDVRYPIDAEIEKEFNITVKTRNIGNESGKFSKRMSVRGRNDRSYRKLVYVNDSKIVEPGEFHTFNTSFSFSNLETYLLRFLGDRDSTGDVRIEPRKLELGESAENLEDIEMKAENLRFQDADEEGKSYAVIDFSATNNAGEEKELPSRTEFEFMSSFRAELVNTTEFGEMYNRGIAEPGETRSGTLVFKISDTYANEEDFEHLEWRITGETPEGYEIGQDGIRWILEN